MRIKSLILAALCMVTVGVYAQSNYPFNGLDMNMGNLSRLSDAKTRSISPENFTGEKGKGGMADPVRDKDQRNVANAHHAAKDLGKGWKVNPFIIVKPGETITIAEIEGPGAIQQIWMTPTGNWRFSILRMYWDDEKEPSVECPVGDFFCSAYNEYAQLSSLAVCVNPGSAFNCYWKMPFRKKARITLENINTAEEMRLYYQINYTLTEVPEDEAYFHAQFRRSNPTQDISGLGPQLAQNIVNYRAENGAFTSRKQLMKVPRMGAKAFEQCAGFLRIPQAENPLDNTAVHPESYCIVEQMAKDLGCSVAELIASKELRLKIKPEKYLTPTVGMPTLKDILQELEKPGRDPRGPIKIFEFDKNVRTINDLREGMELPGIVGNITNFGAFVDIGIKENGLIHLSQLADRFVSDPNEIVSIHQHVRVRVLSVDMDRKRIALKLISE